MNDDPAAEYDARLAARRAEVERLDRRESAIAHARLAVFALVAVAAVLAWTHRLSSAALVPPAAAFLALVVLHDRTLQRRRRGARAVAFYERAIARLEDRWSGSAPTGERFSDPAHLYARDLDLFGDGSLFQRLCTARTAAGEEALAAWLLAPAPAPEVRARQAAVEELRRRLDLREELSLLGDDVRAELDPGRLGGWGAAPASPASPALRIALALLGAAAIATAVAWLGAARSPLPFALALAVEIGVHRLLGARVQASAAAVERPAHDLQVLALVLGRLAREPLSSPTLVALQAALTRDGVQAAEQIARLGRLVQWLQAQRNQLFVPIGYLLLWAPQLTFAVEKWRARSGPAIAGWLRALGELEALTALAAYAYERPHDPFPQLLDEGAHFDGAALGHPLLPDATCVRNDVTLGDPLRLYLVSGSNMSGKSTLLRTVGTNVVLALAGAPVRASRLRLSPLALGATLRIEDSLQAGTSRFYAEILRLRQIVDRAAGAPPLLFILDEILHGTNSHDRRLGAEALVRGLLARGAIGLMTTHDLALAEIVAGLGPAAANVHFEDHLENGKLSFDHRMRAGVVQKSNALELMRAVGLDV